MSENTICGQIVDFLIEIIEKNYNIPTFKLPSEESLALKFGVSRKPVRSAYLRLKERGYVESLHGKGYFIKKSYNAKPASTLKNICLLTPSLRSNFMRKTILGLNDFCEPHNLNLLIMVSDLSIKKEKRLLQAIPLSNAKGAIILLNDNEFYNDELLKLSLMKFPVVIIDTYLKGINFSYVSTDNYNAMFDAIKLLHQKKHESITYITAPGYMSNVYEERITGFKNGLTKYYGAVKANNILIRPETVPAFKKAITDHLKRFPETDIIIATGYDAFIVINAAKELNIPIPEKLKLVVFDNELSDTEKADIRPYIIEQDTYTIGYEAGVALYNQIYGDLRVITKKIPVSITDCSL